MLPALAGLVVGLAYAAISVYWAVGGRWLLTTVGISLSQPGQAGHLAALLAVWGAAGVKAFAAVLPLLAIGVWPRTANGGLRRLARVLTWIEAAILTGYGLVLTASGLLVQAGVIKAAAHADRLALKWHAYLWDPWFLIWGIFVFLALWRSRPASQDHLPGRAPGAVQGATAPAGEQLKPAGRGRGADEDELVAAGRLERSGVALDHIGADGGARRDPLGDVAEPVVEVQDAVIRQSAGVGPK